MKTIISLFITALVFVACAQLNANAQLLGSYDTTGSPNPLTPSSVAANVSLSNFTFGPGFNGFSTGAFSYPGYGAYTTSVYSSSLAAAVAANDYFTFTATPSAGNTLNLSDLDFSNLNFVTQNVAGTFVLQSNVDGFSSNIATFSSSPNAGTAGNDVTLSGTFSNLATATTFRLYVYEAIPDGGGYETSGITGQSSGLGGVLDINGTVTSSVPEPSTYVLTLVGFIVFCLSAHSRRLIASKTI